MWKRTNDNPLSYEDGGSLQGFHPSGGRYLGWEVLPPDNKRKDGTRSFMAPASHIHLLQDEIFTVTQGEGLWHVRGKQPRRLKTGESIVIPKLVAHRFENMPGSTTPLGIDYNYDSSMREMEIRFFCNMLTYLDDCYQARMTPNVFQLCVFLADCYMPIDLELPGPDWMNLILSTLFTYVCAGIGLFVFGYRRVYPEYYEKGGIDGKKKS